MLTIILHMLAACWAASRGLFGWPRTTFREVQTMHKRLALMIAAISALAIGQGCDTVARSRPAGFAAAPATSTPPPARPDEGPIAAPARPQLPADPALADYLAAAALNNPALAAAYADWQAELQTIPQVRALPDPQLSYTSAIRQGQMGSGAAMLPDNIQLMQMLPWIGKLALRGDAAAQAAEAARLRYEARKLELFFQVKDIYYDYYYLGQAVAVTDENVRLLKRIEEVARARYQTGTAGRGDLIRLEVESGKLQDQLRQLRDMRGATQARLLAAIGISENVDLPWPKDVEQATTDITEDQLVQWAQQSNPALLAMDADVAMRQKQILLAKKEYFPDVSLGLMWMDNGPAWKMRLADPAENPPMAMVSVNLPIWWDKLDAGVREAKQRHFAALRRRVDMSNDFRSRVTMAAFQYRDAVGKLDLYHRVLIPRATEALRITETNYSSGTATFADLLDSQRVLLEFQLVNQQAIANRARQLAMLEMLVGRQLPTQQTPTTQPSTQPGKN
jgi:outer membrane protein TolC